ncbi:unnamed protein product [Commensalibacter communis]|nr:unnamed protein product [Commensalibacter communis]
MICKLPSHNINGEIIINLFHVQNNTILYDIFLFLYLIIIK